MEYIKTCFSTSALSTISLPVTITELMASPAALCPSPPFHASSYSFFLALLFLSHFIFSRPVSFFPTVFISPLFLYPPPPPGGFADPHFPLAPLISTHLSSRWPHILSLFVIKSHTCLPRQECEICQGKAIKVTTDWNRLGETTESIEGGLVAEAGA